MIKDKKPNSPPVNSTAPEAERPVVAVPEPVSENPFVNMYQAVRRAILTLREIRKTRKVRRSSEQS